jgi:uncharacterized membrane protein YphA (DoxX/SURF4 family)
MNKVGLAVRVAAAAIWLVAGIAKLFELEHFRSQVAAYKLLPHALVTPFAYGLPFLETFVGVYLLLGLLVAPAAILTCVLMGAFLVAQAQAWARGLSLDCGCFGTLSQQRVGFWSIARDAVLGIPGLILVVRPARFLSLDARYLGLPDAWRPRPDA